jgi:hypothetical protein
MRTVRRVWGPVVLGVCVALVSGGPARLCATLWAQEAEWPTFRPGRWEFTRTIEKLGGPFKPTTLTRTGCHDPTSEMKKQNDFLTRSGCRVSPIVRRGDVYTFSASCTVEGRSSTTNSSLTAQGQDGYTVEIESRIGEEATREKLSARRLGDCEP